MAVLTDVCGRQTVCRCESPLIVRNDRLACRPITDSTYGRFHDGQGRVLTIQGSILTIIGTTDPLIAKPNQGVDEPRAF